MNKTSLNTHVMLIVDDVEPNRLMLAKIFSEDFLIEEACNGAEALEKMHTLAHVDVVLLDIGMPVMDGFTMLEKMHRTPILSKIPVIVVTAATDDDSKVRAFDLGAEDVFAKPYNSRVMKSRVKNVLEKAESAALKVRFDHQEEMLRLARHDSLTGLFNRDAFCERAAAMILSAPDAHYVISCFDVDNFKVINDQYGLEVGNRVLRGIAEHLNNFTYEVNDAVGCRMSADNFAVLFPAEVETPVVELICHEAETLAGEGIHVSLHISVGRCIVDDRSLSVSALIDRALLAKRSVKGRFDTSVAYFNEEMRQTVLNNQSVISRMETALKSGEFEPWLQLQYNHDTGDVCGAEVLVRWRRDGKDMPPVLPGAFIPIFERNGFIYELDKYIWEQSCVILRRWIDNGATVVPLSINISRFDVFCPDFYSVITGLIEKYSLPTTLLRLEITESAFAENTELLVDIVKRLRAYGFIVEIDDFGSAYSSFNTLKDVPADVLKVDMRFLDGGLDSHRGGSILESIVRMSKWLGTLVIAEGVETEKQADFLKSIGCYIIQGYLYSRPLPVSECEKIIKDAKTDPKVQTLETVQGLETDLFWSPTSVDTMIFSSYVGGACVLEYSNGKYELVRANDRFLDSLRTDMTLAEVLSVDPLNTISPRDADYLFNKVAASAKSGSDIHFDLRLKLRETSRIHYEWIRFTGRVIAKNRDRRMVYLLTENITDQKLAEEREKATARRLQSIMANVSCGICAYSVTSEVGHITFANDRYYELFGYTKEQFEAEITNTYDYVYPEDLEELVALSLQALESGSPFTYEYRCIKRDGSLIWVRCTQEVAKIDGENTPVLLTETNDITEERAEREKRSEAERQIRSSAEQLKLLNGTARRLLNETDADEAICGVLRDILDYFDGGRAYVFEYLPGRDAVSCSYEVCGHGLESEKSKLEYVPIELGDFWIDEFEENNHIFIEDVSLLGEDRIKERRVLEARGYKSLVAVPLRRDGVLIGMMGVGDAKSKVTHVDHLEALGDYICVMLTRRDYENKLAGELAVREQMLGDMPGGYVREALTDGGMTKPVFVNDGFCRLLGMTREEIIRAYGKSSLEGVHPDDRMRIQREIRDKIYAGEPYLERYRIKRGDGKYLWVDVTGRLSGNENGERFLNEYYSEVSEKVKQEDLNRELLDNLPCGAAIFEITDTKIRIVCINRRYQEMVQRSGSQMYYNNVLLAVHPDDREKLYTSLSGESETGGSFDGNVRILTGGGIHAVFRLVGHRINHYERATAYVTFTRE